MIRLLVLSFLVCQLVTAAGFRASVVKVDITPGTPKWLLGYGARQSTGVHDPIFHRIVAMDDGETKILLVSTDLCLFSPTVYDEVAQRIQKLTGVAPVRFWWAVTHTHSAPEVGPPGVYKVLLKGRSEHPVDNEYTEKIMSTLVEGAKDALAKLEPARLVSGTGLALANINRRARDADGRISLGLNPDGPVDRQIGLIRIDKADGSPLVLIANYAMHGTVLSGQSLVISGDAQGIVSGYVEQKLGAPMLYINGAAGNIAPIYSVYPDPRSGHLTQFNVLLGDKISIWTYGEVTPPAKFVHDEDGRRGMAVSSLVSGGCIVSGASLRRSLLFTGVRVNSYSHVEDAVVMPYVEIGRNARLKKVVIDRGVVVPDGLIVGEDPVADAKRFRRTENGVCLITKPMIAKLPA